MNSSPRGATTVELALLLAALVLGGAAAFRTLGHATARAVDDGASALGESRSVTIETREVRLRRPAGR